MHGVQNMAAQETPMAPLLVCSIPGCSRAGRLLQSQGMLSMEKALPPRKSGLSQPSLSLEFLLEFQALPCCPWGSTPSQTFKLSSRKTGNLNHGARAGVFHVLLQNVLFQNIFSRPCILMFLETEPIKTTKS